MLINSLQNTFRKNFITSTSVRQIKASKVLVITAVIQLMLTVLILLSNFAYSCKPNSTTEKLHIQRKLISSVFPVNKNKFTNTSSLLDNI